MTRLLTLTPEGWPVPFSECRPGLFVHGDAVAMKTEYGNDEAYCDTGERWCGPQPQTVENRSATLVQPVRAEWVEAEE